MVDEEVTLTGRISRPPTYVRSFREIFGKSQEIQQKVVLLGLDFGSLEARTVAMLVSYDSEKHSTVYTPVLDTDLYSGREAKVLIVDDLYDQVPVNEIKSEPMKQNGRSASYLAHDPTKRKGRWNQKNGQ